MSDGAMRRFLAPERGDWIEMAAQDPRWVVLSDRKSKHGRWDDASFFASGENEISEVMEIVRALPVPKRRQYLLDYGCGLGRTTRAFAQHFKTCLGLDIAPNMAARARELNRDFSRCHFMAYDGSDELPFKEGCFDMIYASLVLQHLPNSATILARIHALFRLLREGGLLCFQLPSALPWPIRLQPRARLYHFLRRLHPTPGGLYWKLGLHPFTTRGIAREVVKPFLAHNGMVLVRDEMRRDANFNFESHLYFVQKPEPHR